MRCRFGGELLVLLGIRHDVLQQVGAVVGAVEARLLGAQGFGKDIEFSRLDLFLVGSSGGADVDGLQDERER